jgi:ABC-2 type transport system permease protein
VGGYIGLLGLGAAFTAIGTAASVGTRNQVVAFLIALGLSTLPFASGFVLSQVPSGILPLVQFLSFETHFNNLARGVIDSRDLIFYGSSVALFLHVAVFGLERRRLR